ncbi:MAG: RsiV family protein [[Clostridium] aminophilum]|uniref:RsiV family protein n=1 Tax=[Clostridium] aminophilum TaxID=1526 RepID=UPI0026EC470F|nr:RsiV family protein [[Clostridium] aminophilum]MDD6196924.1 RsiV family protein [[Clostridium] aminophilum]
MRKKHEKKLRAAVFAALALSLAAAAGCAKKTPDAPTADASEQTMFEGQATVPAGFRMANDLSADDCAKNLGYLPLVSESTGVIAVCNPDGTEVREAEGLTNAGMATFFREHFYYVTMDAAGRSVCCAYDPNTLEKTEVFHADRFPIVRAEKDGYVYYALCGDAADEKAVRFYRAASNGTDNADGFPVEIGFAAQGAGMAEMKQDLTEFVIDGNLCRYYTAKDGGIYAAAAKLTAEGARAPELSETPVETSAMNAVGKMSAEIGEARAADPIAYQEQLNQAIKGQAAEGETDSGSSLAANPDAALLQYYIETIEFSGDSDAAKSMTETMRNVQREIIAEAKEQGEEMAKMPVSCSHPAVITWRFSGTRGVSLNREKILCVEGDRYEWNAEMVSRRKRYFTFDRENGKLLSLADITGTPVEQIQHMVGEAFRKKAEQSNFAYESPAALEHSVADSIGLDSPFFLTDQGIGFFFEPGRIAAESEGFPEVVIPYDKFEMKYEIK